jgi:hypothetical protein
MSNVDRPNSSMRAPVRDSVQLGFPVNADLVILARMTAATIASRSGFDVEGVEDLRLAVDELCISLVHNRRDGRLDLRFVREADLVEVVCTYHPDGRSDGTWSVDEALLGLSGRILDALVDEHGVEEQGNQRKAWLRKWRVRQRA